MCLLGFVTLGQEREKKILLVSLEHDVTDCQRGDRDAYFKEVQCTVKVLMIEIERSTLF